MPVRNTRSNKGRHRHRHRHRRRVYMDVAQPCDDICTLRYTVPICQFSVCVITIREVQWINVATAADASPLLNKQLTAIWTFSLQRHILTQSWAPISVSTNFLSSPFDCSLVGDLSYGDCVGRLWDSYGDMIAPVSSQLPWMVSPGNHEIEQIFVKEIDSNGEQYFSV